jgi:hypothetical protein
VISADYASRQLSGVWKMAWNRPDWATALDRSVDGVFSSFWAMAFATPIALLGFFSARRAAERLPNLPPSAILETPLTVSVLIELSAYLVDWAVGLAALILCARAMNVANRLGDLIIGYNWLQVFAIVGQTIPLLALSLTGRTEIAAMLYLPALALIIALYVGMLRRGSNAGVGVVIAMFALLAITGFLANSAITALGFGLYKAFT